MNGFSFGVGDVFNPHSLDHAAKTHTETPMLRPLIAAAVLPLLMGCASFAHADDLGTRSPQEMSLIDGTCTKVMGLHRGESYFAECQDSLAHSLVRRDNAYAMAAADDACSHQGLKPGSSDFATCMLDRQPAVAAPALQPVALTSDAVEPGRSYYSVAPSVQFQRKRYACAQLGLTPNGGLFGECVASLQGALLSDPN
jgi:hypothetical protein